MLGSELSRESHLTGVAPKYDDQPPFVVTKNSPSSSGIFTIRESRDTFALVGWTVMVFQTKPSNSTRVLVSTVSFGLVTSPASSTAAAVTLAVLGGWPERAMVWPS